VFPHFSAGSSQCRSSEADVGGRVGNVRLVAREQLGEQADHLAAHPTGVELPPGNERVIGSFHQSLVFLNPESMRLDNGRDHTSDRTMVAFTIDYRCADGRFLMSPRGVAVSNHRYLF
jgi:hypothetical protein